MILPRARTIRAKLALLIAASVGAAVLLSFGIGSYRELSRFADAKRSELEATAQILAATVADSVQRQDRSAARQALDAIGRIPDLRFAEIRDANGKLFAEAGIGVALTSGSGARPQSSTIWSMLTNRSVFADADIVKGGRKVGEISLLVDTSELFDRFRQALVAALASAVGAVLVGLVIAARLQRSITRPLGELAQTMNSVRTTSDFTQRAERRSDDETGQLVDSFNDMLDQIRNRDDALEEHRAGLERTVEERTRELADARDVAVSANRAKSDFLATMSHEIRTPLNGMLVVAELLTRGNLPGRQQRYAEIISRSGQTLLSIINDILDLSKIEAGKLTLEQGRIEPAQIVSDVLGLFWERAASKGLDLAGIVAPGVPACVEGDPVRLSQVISNLVNNALKFTERGQVSVEIASIESDGTDFELQISVRDTGIGIAADKLDQVFEAFSQADSSTTRRFGGTGLGLSISQRLVRAMGGRIWVESEPGIGSQFCFTIRAKVLQSADVSPARPAGGPRRAVVAVEGAATRQAIAYALASAGYAVTEAPAGDAVRVDSAADLVFAEAPAAARLAGTARPGSTRVIAVVTPGDSSADALLDSDLLAGSLARPVTSSDVRKLLADVGSESRRQAARRREAPVAANPTLARLRVLVADDSPVNREVAREVLTLLGVACTLVEDGAQAVEACRGGRFDIVLMDRNMPVLDGLAATREIRSHEQRTGAPRTPVIALTAHVGGAGDFWQSAGMDDYLLKPFTIKSLSDCLARWAPQDADRKTAEAAPSLEAAATATTPVPSPEAGPLDAGVLKGYRELGSGDAFLIKVLTLFRSHTPAHQEALESALASGDLELIAAEAHALKSPSRNIGAMTLAEHYEDIERRARSGKHTVPDDPALDAMRSEFQRVLAAVDQLVGATAAKPRMRAATA